MTLLPDRTKKIFSEDNVDITQGGTKPEAAYDLALYEELGQITRAVLEVTIILVFDFEDTDSKWTEKEKDDFMKIFRLACAAAWGEKHRLVTRNPMPLARSAGVIFDIKTREGWDIDHSHWNVKCRKVDSMRPSFVRPGGGGCLTNGKAEWDSLDLDPEEKDKRATTKQRAAIHEFGHMLGYRDEYPDSSASPKQLAELYNRSHPSDTDSIMYWGEKIYPRHYVFFADWISLQWMKKDRKNCKGHDWKVNGLIDTTNAGLS
jgi:hypothetical protein